MFFNNLKNHKKMETSGSVVQNLENIEKEIKAIVNKNDELILLLLQKYQASEELIVKKVYKVSLKELPKNHFAPYSFRYEEVKETNKKCDFLSQWRVPDHLEKPQEVDPDELLFGKNRSLMDLKCEDFTDLIRFNKQYSVVVNYLTLLREQVSLKFGLKFKRNFEIVHNLLNKLIEDLKVEETNDTDNKQIEGTIENLNSQIFKLFESKMIRNELFPIEPMKIDSKILNNAMKEMLEKMLYNQDLHFRFEKLLYVNGNPKTGVSDFHKVANGVGPTLTIIQSQNNYIFGAFIKDKFQNRNEDDFLFENPEEPFNYYDPKVEKLENFIFGLGKSDALSPIKLLKNKAYNPKIYEADLFGFGQANIINNKEIFKSNCGLHVGTDLVAFCGYSCSPSLYTEIALGYPQIAIDSKTLAGTQYYDPAQIEVFLVKIQ